MISRRMRRMMRRRRRRRRSMRIKRRVEIIVILERKVVKVEMQAVMNDMVVKGRMRDVVKMREEKAAKMIVGKIIQVKEL
jgi:hypothetical protein